MCYFFIPINVGFLKSNNKKTILLDAPYNDQDQTLRRTLNPEMVNLEKVIVIG